MYTAVLWATKALCQCPEPSKRCIPQKFKSHICRGSFLLQDPETTKAGKNLDKRLCFGLEDFRLGTFISVYGRDLFIHDCDDFTRNWFQVAPLSPPGNLSRDRSFRSSSFLYLFPHWMIRT